MPRKAAKKSSKPRRATKPRVRQVPRRVRNVSEYASLSETTTLKVGSQQTDPVTNTLYSLMNTSLSQFDRATQVAKAYQHYRIKYIQLKIKPSFDTYAVSNTIPNSKPNVYYMIDKAGAIPTNITLEGLKKMGAKPRALDEKPIVIGWKPSVLENVMTAGGGAPLTQGARYKISPWLNTNANSVDIAVWNPSSVDHLGLYWYVEQNIANPGNQPYTIEYEVQFEFKKPLMATAVGEFHAVPVTLAIANASRDGIVGGVDDAELVR